MGPLALLDFLELHLGLSNACSNKIERIFNYRENLGKNAKGCFYEKSLQTNDLEVSIKLIKWRDELKTSGWDFKTDKSCPGRLKDLAKVEQQSIAPGTAERFCNIIEALNKTPLLPVNEIIVHEPLDLLPSHITKLFQLIAATGVSIKYRETPLQKTFKSDLDNLSSFILNKNPSKEKIKLNADGSIQIIKFGDMLSAGKGLAALMAEEHSFKPVVINESGDISLSLSLRESGLPSTGQAMHSNSHPDLQLLAIIPVWLRKPYDPDQILNFFLSPLNIFPNGLSGKWMELFSENPGICLEDWAAKIEEYTIRTKTEKDKIKHHDRLSYVLNMAEEASEKISIDKIRDYYNFFYNIFNKRFVVTTDENIKQRLQRLCNAFKEFIAVLDLTPEKEVNLFGLQKLLQLVLQPVSIIPFGKEATSLHEISDAGLLTADCDDLLWFGFTANKMAGTIWDEWTIEELKWLNDKNIFPDTAVLRAKRDSWFLTQWLRFVRKRLILIIPSVMDGESAQPHSFHPFINACFKDLHSITINVEQPAQMRLLNANPHLTKKIPVNPIPSFPDYWQIKPGLITKRKEESYSSLENLMKYPYRWILSYKAELYRGNTLCLPDNFTFYGNLSHEIFQELLLMPHIMKLRESEVKKLYSITAEKYINQKGLLLNTRGEEANLKIFRESLFDKFWILLSHLKENNWLVEGCEIKASGNIGEETVGGYCDLLLNRVKDKKLEKAIVDLKYSGRAKYRRLMEDGEDLQLAIYSKIFHPIAKFCATSYFIISDGLLFTTSNDAFFKGIILRQNIIYSETYAHVLHKIENTIKFRRKEFSKGTIEVGENVPAEDLDVFGLDPENYIIPKLENKAKISSMYNDYVTFINTE